MLFILLAGYEVRRSDDWVLYKHYGFARERALKESVVAILLISADFLASDFIDSDELPPLLAAAAKEDTVILDIRMRR